MIAAVRAAAVVTLTIAAAACAPGTSSTPATGSQMPEAILAPYLKIQTALAQDSLEGLRANAGTLATAATALGAPALKIYTSALQLAPADELPDARMKFARVSDAIVAYMTGLGLTPPAGVRVAFCSATDKTWLQEGNDISSPYEGTAATCGEFR
jgi:hypothetical protein